jgi:hypothetical protein
MEKPMTLWRWVTPSESSKAFEACTLSAYVSLGNRFPAKSAGAFEGDEDCTGAQCDSCEVD